MNLSQEPATPGGYEADGWYPVAWTPPARPWRRTLAVGVLTVLTVTAAGGPLGLLWSWLSPSVPVADGANGIVVTDPSPEQFIAADGWFSLLGFGFGALVAVAAWLILRRHRGPVLLVSVVVGALGAAVVAWQVGRQFGLSGWDRWQQTAVAGQAFQKPPDLHTHSALLVPAFAAVIVCTLLAGWSNDPDLDVAGARPGYGHDIHHEPADHGPADHGPADHGPADASSGSPAGLDPTGVPAPPAPGPAAPPRD